MCKSTTFSFTSSNFSVFFFSRNLFPVAVFSKKGLEEISHLPPSACLTVKGYFCFWSGKPVAVHLQNCGSLNLTKRPSCLQNYLFFHGIIFTGLSTSNTNELLRAGIEIAFERRGFISFREAIPVFFIALLFLQQEVNAVTEYKGISAELWCLQNVPQPEEMKRCGFGWSWQHQSLPSLRKPGLFCGPFHSKRCKFCFIKW